MNANRPLAARASILRCAKLTPCGRNDARSECDVYNCCATRINSCHDSHVLGRSSYHFRHSSRVGRVSPRAPPQSRLERSRTPSRQQQQRPLASGRPGRGSGRRAEAACSCTASSRLTRSGLSSACQSGTAARRGRPPIRARRLARSWPAAPAGA